MFDKLYKLIKNYEEKGDFTYANVSEEVLDKSEKRLDIKFSDEYKWFLKKFGHGGIGGIEILGVGKDGTLVFEKETLKYRAYGLPNELLIVENCDEWIYCINSINGKVVIWSQGAKNYTEAYDSFCLYLLDRINDILDNM